VFNYCSETSLKAATRTDIKRKWLTGFDPQAARRLKLRWRVSRGARRSLGWIPFTATGLKRKGVCLRFAGTSHRPG
jgi:hypothetical protein